MGRCCFLAFMLFGRREENERFLLCATEQAVYMINCINSEVHVHGFRDDKDEAVLVRNVTFLHLQNDGKVKYLPKGWDRFVKFSIYCCEKFFLNHIIMIINNIMLS